MFYDYTDSKKYCESLGLTWLGDEFVRDADSAANFLNFTQDQVDAAMRHHLQQVKWLFTPQNYPWLARMGLAWHFLFGKLGA